MKRKPILAALLCLAFLLLSLAVPAFAAFSDESAIGTAYRTAVSEMSARGVLNGFPDGSFQPRGTLTREQGAKIVTYIVLGQAADRLVCAAAPFTDVAPERWSAPCIAWCVERVILLGYGGGVFGPDDPLTGDQFAKMLLCALGLARENHYVGYGDRWTAAVRADGESVGLYAGDAGMKTDEAIRREQAALLAWNAIRAAEARGDSSALPTDPVISPDPPAPNDPDPTLPNPATGGVDDNGNILLPEIPKIH